MNHCGLLGHLTWNCLAKDLKLSPNLTMNQFKSVLHKYYLESLSSQFDPEVPRSWKTICPSCNSAHKMTPYATLFLSVNFILIIFNFPGPQ